MSDSPKKPQSYAQSYAQVYADWQRDPEAFWMQLAEDIDWIKKPSRALFAERAPFYTWFADGLCNSCDNAVDRHVRAGRGAQAAIIYESPISKRSATLSYAELQDRVARVAGMLAEQGVTQGDRVLLFMPMIPEALIAMLACARIGAIHSLVFGGFAARELAVRIDDAQPRAILAASCGLEPDRVIAYKPLLDDAMAQATHPVECCFIWQREEGPCRLTLPRDLDWREAEAKAEPVDPVPLRGDHPLYILYTSGTTGQPKGVVRHNGGHLVAMQWSMHAIYDMQPGEVYWAASDVGWIVGHSYIVYAPLIYGCTTVVFEGKPVGTPDAAAFWRVIEKHRVKTLFTAPTAFRAIRRADSEGELIGDYDLSSLNALFLAGERADPDTLLWAEQKLQVPVIDHWWQTETSWAICANPLGIEKLAIKPGSPTVPMPGYKVKVLDERGAEVPANRLGSIVIELPLPPSTLPTLWNADARFQSAYLEAFPGYYNTGDAGLIDEDGYLHILSRTDDVINVAGHRLSTGGMEEVLATHPDVAECAVIGAADRLKGQLPVGFLCLNSSCKRAAEEIEQECIKLVREKIGPVAAFKRVISVARLPKTRSGKILRGTMAKIADGAEWSMPATVDDPLIFEEIAAALRKLGYPEAEASQTKVSQAKVSGEEL